MEVTVDKLPPVKPSLKVILEFTDEEAKRFAKALGLGLGTYDDIVTPIRNELFYKGIKSWE